MKQRNRVFRMPADVPPTPPGPTPETIPPEIPEQPGTPVVFPPEAPTPPSEPPTTLPGSRA